MGRNRDINIVFNNQKVLPKLNVMLGFPYTIR